MALRIYGISASRWTHLAENRRDVYAAHPSVIDLTEQPEPPGPDRGSRMRAEYDRIQAHVDSLHNGAPAKQ